MKKVILTEEQVKHIINEELGIAKEVSNLSEIIEEKIYNYLSKGINSGNFDVKTELSEFNVEFLFKVFRNKDEMYEWFKINKISSGYSYEENKIYIVLYQLAGVVNYDDFVDTIQHECSHYWECKMKGGPIYNNYYQEIQRGMENKNPVVSTICKMLYYCNHNEITAFVNGSYKTAIRKNKKYTNYKEFIMDNGIKEVYTVLKNSHDILSKYDDFNTLCLTAFLYFVSHKIIPSYSTFDEMLNYLYKITEDGYNYFIKKLGMAYALYCKKQEDKKDLLKKKLCTIKEKF